MRKKFKPLYKTIEAYIVEQIRSGKWPPQARIPSENELSEQFGVSRITVKNALTELVERGVVFRQQGKGTFVAAHNGEELPAPPSAEERGRSAFAPAAPPPKTIGFLIPRLDNRFTANLLSGIEDELSERGCRLLFAKTNESQEEEIRKIRELRQYGVQGLIIYPVEGERYNSEIVSLTLDKFPLVLVDRLLRGIETNAVSSDNFAGAMQAVEHLLALGHRQIGFLSTRAEGTTSIEERLDGYEKALENRRLPIDRSLEMTRLSLEGGDEEAEPLIERFLLANRQMTALLSSNYSPAVFKTAKRLGIRVPEELSIVIFDDIEQPALAQIPPTVVAQQERELGREAGRLIAELLEPDGSGGGHGRQVKLAPSLIVRGSTAPPRTSL